MLRRGWLHFLGRIWRGEYGEFIPNLQALHSPSTIPRNRPQILAVTSGCWGNGMSGSGVCLATIDSEQQT
jgi:hypothetical protein